MFHLDKSKYIQPKRYKKTYVTYDRLQIVIKNMEELGYIEIRKGYFYNKKDNRNLITRMWATPILFKNFLSSKDSEVPDFYEPNEFQDIIILRDKDKKGIDYKDNKKTRFMREQLQKHNEFIDQQTITMELDGSVEISNSFLVETLYKNIVNRKIKIKNINIDKNIEQLPIMISDKLGVPHIPMLKENNVRKGFFEHDQFLALREHLSEHLKGFVTFAYKTGWRVSEISELTWQQLDREQGIVRIEAGETKNDEARTVYMDEELNEIVKQQWEACKRAEKLLPHIFLNKHGTGKIKDFKRAWKNACEKSGIGKMFFHDLRRTAIRNMIRSGIPERVAMMISGHKTRSVFDRYNIVNDADLKLASEKYQKYLDSRVGTISGTMVNFERKKGQSRAL
jgi:integrase